MVKGPCRFGASFRDGKLVIRFAAESQTLSFFFQGLKVLARTRASTFKPWKKNDKVWLSAANLITNFPSRKLAPKRHGPFTIEKVISPITFRLTLPKTWKVHPVFHA